MIGSSWSCATQHLRIAIANDDAARADVLEDALRQGGHRCYRYLSGDDLLRGLDSNSRFDALVLERELPDLTGIELLRAIRERPHCRTPIIFTSAFDEETDIVEAMWLGADGYLVWPIRGAEFVARVEAIVRRGIERVDSPPVQVDGYQLDTDARLVFRHNHALPLTEKEFNLAALFLVNPGRVVSRIEIVQCARGSASSSVRWRTVQTHISSLRRKLKLTHSNEWRLAAIHGRGYRLEKRHRHSQTRAEVYPPEELSVPSPCAMSAAR